MMTDAELDAIEERAFSQTNRLLPRPEALSRDCLLLIAELRSYRQARGWPAGILIQRPWWRFW